MRTSFSYVLISSDTFCLNNGTGDYRTHKKCPFSFLVSKSLFSRTFELYDVSYSFFGNYMQDRPFHSNGT